jgi:hypothetical protein
MERRGRKCKQLLDHLKEMRRYWTLKEEALDVTLWRTGFGRGYGAVVRQTTYIYIYSLTSYVVWGGFLSLIALLSGWHHQLLCSSRSYGVVCCVACKPLIRNSLCALTI